MVEVLPMQDRGRERTLLKSWNINDAGPRVLAMTERGQELGLAAVKVDGHTVYLLRLCAGEYDFTEPPQEEQAFVLDTLIRSAASYGETFGACLVKAVFPDFFEFLKIRGFHEEEGILAAPMNYFVHYK